MGVNYADTLEEKPKKKKSKRRIVAIILLIIGLAALGVAAYQLYPEYKSEQHVEEILDDAVPLASPDMVADADDINWDHLADIDGNIKAWLKVDNTNINYPVAQGDDNEYYLYHNVYGERSYAGIFADYRADINGANVIIYGHHMANGTMFSDVSHSHHQNYLDSLGTLHYTTKEGLVDFEPAFAMSVEKHYAPVQKFSFEPHADSLDRSARAVAAFHGLSGSDTITYEVLPNVFAEEAYNAAEDLEVQNWLREMYQSAESKASNVDYLISNADRAIVLCTCSSGIGGMPWRTYTVFISTGLS